MQREQVDDMLRAYRALIGRCGHIEAEIDRLERAIEAQQEAYARNACTPTVSCITGMPRSGGIADPTARTAMALMEGRAIEDSPEGMEIRRLRAQIDALRIEREDKQLRVRYVDSWLSGLAERERWVIERHVIEGEIWHDIIQQFNVRYMDDVSKDRLKRMQQKALMKIYAMAA